MGLLHSSLLGAELVFTQSVGLLLALPERNGILCVSDSDEP
jgi:hypothetical protein